MKTPPFSRFSIPLLIILGGCVSNQSSPTIDSLEQRELHFEQPQVLSINQKQVAEKYRQLINSNQDSEVRGEAMRRLADLELEIGEVNNMSDNPGLNAEGERKMRSAIELYNANLRAYPERSWNDLVLYQLAKAYNLVGEPENELRAMNQLVSKYPDTRYLDEIQFRRAEILFVMRNYPAATDAYHVIVNNFPDSIYYEKALYKLGWSQFKQQKYNLALDSYIALLDRKMAQGLIQEERLQNDLSRADHELLSDTLRVVSLSFSYQAGAESIKRYFTRRGDRKYEALLYRQLGELYLSKERITDAADVYLAYVSRFPESHLAPQLHTDAIDAYKKGNFPTLVLSAKEEFVRRYGVDSRFWKNQNETNRTQVKPLLTRHIKELAAHYHTLARTSGKSRDYQRAAEWYSTYLHSFPGDSDAAQMNFLLAEALYDGKDYSRAVKEYENSAYNYPQHPKGAEAGYAALLTYDLLNKRVDPGNKIALQQRAITSALLFCEHFPEDKRVPSVLTRTSEKLFALNDYQRASDTAKRLLEHKSVNDTKMRITALTVYGHSQFELGKYSESEQAYYKILQQTPRNDKQYKQISDRLAASIYKQGEIERNQGALAVAAGHFMRVGEVVPNSTLRATAQYDAATIYIEMGEWRRATGILEDFRRRYPKEKKLQHGVTEKLAAIYTKTGQGTKAAREMLALAAVSDDMNYQREMMLQAAQSYDQADNKPKAAATYKDYIKKHPRPLSHAIEAQHYLADFYRTTNQHGKRYYWLNQIVSTDSKGGKDRSDRTRYLAANATLELAAPARTAYQQAKLTVPLKRSLKKKKSMMKKTIKLYEQAIKYNVSDVTTAATYQLAEVYNDFARSLMESQRPKKLSAEELEQYTILLEEQAYPFEEKAIDIHVANLNRTQDGIYDKWVKMSHKVLAKLQPVRYAKHEKTASYAEVIQ